MATVVLPVTVIDNIRAALAQLVAAGDEDALPLLRQLIAALRPPRHHCEQEAPLRWRFLLESLVARPEWCAALRRVVLRLFATRRQVSFYADSGLLPNTGFFTELNRILTHKVLPELRDPGELRTAVALLFSHRDDERWLGSIPLEDRRALWNMLDLQGADGEEADALHGMVGQMLDALLVLSHRIASMGLSPDLQRVYPRLRETDSPFMALNMEIIPFVEGFRQALAGGQMLDDGSHVFVLVDQCNETVKRARAASSKLGTSMALSFLLTRLGQHLDRLTLLLKVMTVRVHPEAHEDLTEYWTDFLFDALDGERQHNSVSRHVAELFSLLALRITDNAAQTGEHYIATARNDWFHILGAAAGAGFVIALLAFLKIAGTGLALSFAGQCWLNAMIYAGGFALVYVLHLVIATKQPAMTAATIAGSISQTRGRLRELEKIVDLVVHTSSSQIAAIAGNIGVAFPVAMLLLSGIGTWSGGMPVSVDKAHHLLDDLQPVGSYTLLYAAVAGVWLFMTGLVSGYLDNRAAYIQLGPRIAQLRLLQLVGGQTGAARVGDYIARHAGGLGGNLFFGVMLGITPLLGQAFGIPLDIRHIAFSSANLGYALVTLEFVLSPLEYLLAVSGVLLIGIVNLTVSFSLALWVAMRSRQLDFWSLASVLPLLWRRWCMQPSQFFLPPPAP